MKNSLRHLPKLSKNFLLYPIKFYQRTISPDHGIFTDLFGLSRCRFYPSCSAYALEALRQYGLLRGAVSSLKRILKCNPFFRGGYDPLK